MAPPKKRRLSHESRVFLYTLLGGLPAVIVAMTLLLTGDFSPKVQWTLGLVIFGFWLGYALAVRERVVHPLQTMANLLTALREGDFSTRARGANRDEPLGDVYAEINLLSGTLQEQRLGALEATALLRTVMEEIDVAIFAFDANETLRLVNRAGQELIAQPAERILGRPAKDLDLADCLVGDGTRVLSRTFPGGTGRWGMRSSSSPTSASRCARRSSRPGSASCASSATSSTTPSPRSNPSPARLPRCSSARSALPTGKMTCAAASRSSRRAPRA